MGTKGESDGGSIFAWVFWSMAKVNKGMRTVSDSVWRWGHAPFPAKMDTLNTLLLGWLFFALLLIILAKFLYDKYLSGGDDLPEEYFTNGSEREEPKLPKGGCLGPAPNQVSKTPSIVPAKAPARNSAPLATGGEPDAVRWINNLLVWFYEGSEGGHVIRENWNDALNEFTVGAALEAGVLVEVLEFFPQTPQPNLTNIIVDCDPTDNMTVTCDMEQTIYLRVQTTRTQREVTTESEYACAVRPLRGRLNIAVETHQCAAFIKFDGWPEVQLEFEGIRNNSSGLDEEQLQEVVSEVLVAALRKVNLHLDFLNHKNFPRFSRARSVPDQVIPVGYDSLVREAQTHPPSFTPKIPVSRKPFPSVAAPIKGIDQVKSEMGILASPTKAEKGENLVNSNAVKENSVTKTDLLASTKSNNSYGYSFSFSEDENLEEAGESFSAMSYSSPMETDYANENSKLYDLYTGASAINRNQLLTLSEESLVARRLQQYDREPSLESVDLSKVMSKYGQDDSFYSKEKSDSIEDTYYIPHKPSKSPNTDKKTFDVIHRERTPEPKPNINGSHDYSQNTFDRSTFSREENGPPNDSFIEEDDEIFLDEPESLKETLLSMKDSRPLQEAPDSPSSSPRDSIRDEMELLKDSLVGGSNSFAHSHSSPVGIVGLNGKRLLVKVVKASGLGADDSVDSSYAVVEMDEPSQRFTTAAVSESTAPFWDEQFLFDLSENTLELLFEIYDKSNDRFLGLGIVGIEELVATPSQRQIIPLQARPYENDKVSGSLTCEFLFLDRADLPDLTLRAGSGGVSQSSPRLRTTMTTYVKPLDETASDEGTADVAAAAIKDLEERQSMPLNQQVPSAKSTMIIHASRKVERTPSGEYKELVNGELQPMDDPRFEGPASVSTPRATHVSQTPSSPNKSGSFRQASSIKALPTEISPEIRNTNDQPSPSVPDVEERSRSRNRGRDFFGSIRRRFSRSKNRSKSVEPTNNVGLRTADLPLERDPLAGRSVSVERSSTVARSRGYVPNITSSTSNEAHKSQRFLSVPGKNRSSSSGLAGDSGSTRSSLSGASGLSSASTKTYINEASLLVVETLENGIIKHYLVPLTLQRKNKWRKKGTKLHIYNEHTFVAKHMSSSVSCEVCNKALARRIGKQGYECRDCSFKCHKPCHVKAETPCPNSTVNTMDLVYVKDERAERKKAARSS